MIEQKIDNDVVETNVPDALSIAQPADSTMSSMKFRPRTPILEDAHEAPTPSSTPRPSIDVDQVLQPPPRSPTPSKDITGDGKSDGNKKRSSSPQPQKLDAAKALPTESDENATGTEVAAKVPIKTVTYEKGKSKVTGKTITGWI